jgi:hypothetical protein
MKYNELNVICYQICLWLIELVPLLKYSSSLKGFMDSLYPDWVEWKTETTLKEVDQQVEEITKDWQAQDNQKVVEKFQEVYPEAKVTVHDPETGAVLIEHPPDGSGAQELLGGAMEIRSPWSEGKM